MAALRQSCCIKISDFPMRCEELRDRELCDLPYIITRDNSIAYISTLAARTGVDFRMSVNLVKAIYPGVRILPYDGDLYCTMHRVFLDIYADCSPFVEPMREGEAFIDLTGVQDDAAEVRRIIDRVRTESPVSGIYMAFCSSTSKLISRIGANIAAASSDSWRHRKGLAKHVRDSDADFVFLVIKDESKADFIERLPIQYLWSANAEDVSKLYQLGINRIGDIRKIPVSVLAGQIGDSAYRVLEMSYGIDGTPVYPCYPEVELWEKRTFEGGADNLESLTLAMDDILQVLVKRLTDMDMTTSSLSLQVFLSGKEEGRVISHDKKLKRPTASLRYVESALNRMIQLIVRDLCTGDSGSAGGPHSAGDSRSAGDPHPAGGSRSAEGSRPAGSSHSARSEVSEHNDANVRPTDSRVISGICVRFKDIQRADAGKVNLFDDVGKEEREQLLERTMFSIEGRFGANTIELAGALASSRRDKLRAALDVF